jgi:hypothetical protein
MFIENSLSQITRTALRTTPRQARSPAVDKFSALMRTQTASPPPDAPLQSARVRALAGLAKVVNNTGDDPLADAMTAQSVRNMIGALNREAPGRLLSSRSEAAAAQPLQLERKKDVLPASGEAAGKARAELEARRQDSDAEKLGALSARFESGSAGIAAIGYDRVGGTSYGKYQIASKPGSMKQFIQFLDSEAPDLAAKLRAAGPANTGGRKGAMPAVWKELAEAEPERFAALQEGFIRHSHYEPALASLRQAGFSVENFSPALKEVLWSTSVQHGPAAASRIFLRAAEQAGSSGRGEQEVIRGVYAVRAGQFTSSTESVRAAVQDRLRQEQRLALAMLNTAAG